MRGVLSLIHRTRLPEEIEPEVSELAGLIERRLGGAAGKVFTDAGPLSGESMRQRRRLAATLRVGRAGAARRF